MKRYWTLRAAGVFILAAGLLWAAPRELKPGFNLFSQQQDVQLGRELAAQVDRQVPRLRDSEVEAYVARIGRRLAAQPEAGRFPYTFKVTADRSVNAFALPGGPIYVNRGLIQAVDNEAQLAGVIAHEIAHVALRHSTNQASKAQLIQIPAMLAGGLAGQNLAGQLARLGIGLGANSALLKFSRSAERDADLLGARIMARAGYNPIEMARFFEKLEGRGGHGVEFLSRHPKPGNRSQSIQEDLRYFPRGQYQADSGQLRRMQARLR
jgi:beta-barrel assembly-enhancing protease